MQIKNTKTTYGIVAILLHWLMAVLIIGLFVLGVYMVDLDYYSKWYNAAPWWHKSVGILVFFLLLYRLGWVLFNVHPEPLSTYKRWEIIAAKITHLAFYLLLFVITISGYFITTAKGASIDMFGWLEIPAITTIKSQRAELIGKLHEFVAYIVAALFLLHVCASFKHHFLDKDSTLVRMLKPIKPDED